MNGQPRFVVAAAFTSVHEAHLARSVLEAAGIETTIADEHLVSMTWTYSNAVGGVKVLVPDDRLEEARSLLESNAITAVVSPTADLGDEADDGGSDECQRCGSREFESRLPGKRFAILSWLVFGVPLGSPLRRRYCRKCGEPVSDRGALA
jgi:Putative prokaryotic signal transducing protein